MNAIRVKTRVDSETLHLPELKPLIGKNVEIIVLEEGAISPASNSESGDFWRNKSLDEIASEQGVKPITDVRALLGGWPKDELDDGFEQALERWRREDSTGGKR